MLITTHTTTKKEKIPKNIFLTPEEHGGLSGQPKQFQRQPKVKQTEVKQNNLAKIIQIAVNIENHRRVADNTEQTLTGR